MSNLQKVSPQLIKFRNLETDLYREKIAEQIRKAHVYAGVKKIDVELAPEEVTLTIEVLQKDFPWLSTFEFREYVIRTGATGGYGEFYGINPKTIAEWCRAYSQSPERKEFAKFINSMNKPKELPQNATMTLEQKQEAWTEGKERIKQGKPLLGAARFYYEIARDLGKVDIEDEMFIEEVRYHAAAQIKQNIENLKATEGIIAKSAIEQLKKMLKEKKGEGWQIRCKGIAVELIMKDELENEAKTQRE